MDLNKTPFVISAFVFVIAVAVASFALGRYLTPPPEVKTVYPDIANVSGTALTALKDNPVLDTLQINASLAGFITAIENSGITVAKNDSPEMRVVFTPNTVILDSLASEQPKNIGKDDLALGNLVQVVGNLEGNKFLAELVVRIPTQ